MAGRRVSLTALADKTAIPVPDPAPAQDDTSPPVTEKVAAEPAKPKSTGEPVRSAARRPPVAQARSTPSRRVTPRRTGGQLAPGQWVRFDQYERKEARLRPDQYGRLSTASRNLNRARGGSGERITENTLIRIAIDLLLAREGELAGATEAELRESLGL